MFLGCRLLTSQALGEADRAETSTGLPAPSPSLGLSCCWCVQPMFPGWKMGLLIALWLARATGLFFQTPRQHLISLFHLCFGNVPSMVEAVEEGALCSAPVHLSLLSQIIFATN